MEFRLWNREGLNGKCGERKDRAESVEEGGVSGEC
jgi:hypothetical protein